MGFPTGQAGDDSVVGHLPEALKKKWYLDDITDWLPTDTNSHWD